MLNLVFCAITFDGKSSPDNPDGVLRRHPDTSFVRTPEQGGTTCAGVRGITGDGLPSKVIAVFPKKQR